jgi:hypothetical protein
VRRGSRGLTSTGVGKPTQLGGPISPVAEVPGQGQVKRPAPGQEGSVKLKQAKVERTAG